MREAATLGSSPFQPVEDVEDEAGSMSAGYTASSSVIIRSWSGGSLTPRLSLTVAHT